MTFDIKNIFKKKKVKIVEGFSSAGHTFKVLDPTTMPKSRQSAFYLGEYEREWGMTKVDLIAYDDAILEKLKIDESWHDKHDLVDLLIQKNNEIYNLVNNRRLILQEDFQYAPFLKAACQIILIDDEDPKILDPKLYSKKMKLCSDHYEIMVFF